MRELTLEETNDFIEETKNSENRNGKFAKIFEGYEPASGYKPMQFGKYVVERNVHGVSGAVTYSVFSPVAWEKKSYFAKYRLGEYTEPEVGIIAKFPQKV